MSENISNKNVRDDEIDLLDLFQRMGRTFNRWGNKLGRAFLITIVFVLKRWLPLGISIALGIGVSYFLKTTATSFYTSDLVLRTNTVSAAEMIPYINKLHTFCAENNTSALTNAISSNSEQINNILDISAFWIIDKGNDSIPDLVDYSNSHDIYDTANVRMMDRLDIRAKITSSVELTNLKNGIIKFLYSDSLFQQRNRLIFKQKRELLTQLNNDIIQLDSLQKVKYFEETRNRLPQNGGQMIFLQEQKTQLVYSDIYKLYKRKQKLELEIDLYQDFVTVLSDFSVPAKRDNGTMYYGKQIIPIFFGFTLLILIILANRKKLLEVYKKY